MANIFSGLFNTQAGGSGGALAKYKQELEDYGLKRDAYQQGEAVKNIDPYIKQVLESMSPGRRDQVMLQRAMMQQQPMYDKGIEGFNNSVKQRGGTIADRLKQDKSLEIANAKHLFKVNHPTAESTNKKIETAEWYKAQDQETRSLARDSWRDRQYLDTKTGFTNAYDKTVIYKNLIQAGVDEAQAPVISERLTSFYNDVDAAEDTLVVLENNRKRIQKLYEITPDNTGWNAVFSLIPAGDAHQWGKLRDTVVSNIGLDKILSLKASSSQGATGLGALNEAELKMLQDHLGNLDQTNDPYEIQAILKQLDGDMQNVIDRKIRKLRQNRAWYNRNKTYQGIKAGSPDLILPEQEYLFSKEGYNKPASKSTLGDEDKGIENRLLRYSDD